jgi:acetyl-CoA C-acetyltransferase
MATDIVIVAAARTAVGKFGGTLAATPASELGAAVIQELLKRSKLSGEQINEVILGQVLTAGVGQNPARQAVIKSGLPKAVPAMTINKVCGSGLKAVMLGTQAIRDGDSEIVIAGGQESMSMSPHVLQGSRNGQRMGDWKMVDTMIIDGLWDVYNQYHMGITAENVAKQYGITREAQDALALGSQQKAAAAQDAGKFKDEIVPFSIAQKKGDPLVFAADEFINRKSTAEVLAGLRPAFDKAGSVTAGNASGLNDGAAGVVLMTAKKADQLGLQPLGRIGGPRPGDDGHGPRAGQPPRFGARRLEAGRLGPARNQRSLRGASLRGAQGNGLGLEQGQCQRRRDRDRPPDWCQRLPHPGDAAARDAAPQCQERDCEPMHRRWHGCSVDH